MSRISRHVSSPQWIWYISRNARFTVGRKRTNPETLKFLKLLKQRSKKYEEGEKKKKDKNEDEGMNAR